jgi:hypothetical protein
MVMSSVSTISGGSSIRVILPAIRLPTQPGSFSLTLSTKTSDDYTIDTNTVVLVTNPRVLVGSEIVINSSSSTTSSVTNYTITLSIPISLGIPYRLLLYIPFNTYATPSVNNNQLTSTYNSSTSILQVENAGSTLVISGFMTY